MVTASTLSGRQSDIPTSNGEFHVYLLNPEPGSLALLGMAVLPVVGVVRRRRNG